MFWAKNIKHYEHQWHTLNRPSTHGDNIVEFTIEGFPWGVVLNLEHNNQKSSDTWMTFQIDTPRLKKWVSQYVGLIELEL